MTPKKRVKADVQKILDNPVQSDVQQVISPKKEGFWGWMSYVGWSLIILFYSMSCLSWLYSEYEVIFFLFHNEFISTIFTLLTIFLFIRNQVYSPYPRSFIGNVLLSILITFLICVSLHWLINGYNEIQGLILLLLTLPCTWHLIKKTERKIFFKRYMPEAILFVILFLSLFYADMDSKFSKIIRVIITYYTYSIMPYITWAYLCLFYKKSKDGYNRVWLKVLLFSILPLLFLLNIKIEERYPEGLMGDILG